jgi:hypothetical protein
LLLIEINSLETTSIIPGKLFEYIISERPIIAIGPANSDFAEIIKETNSGFFFDYTQKEGLKKTILDYFEKYKSGNLISNPSGIEKYSRRNLTETLSHLILNI